MARFVVFKGFFQYDAVNRFAEELGQGLQQYGHDVCYLDGRDETSVKGLPQVLTSHVDYAVSFNGAGSGFELMKSDTHSIYELNDIKFIAVLLDHPSHHLPRLNGKNTYITSYDHSHIDFLNTRFNGEKVIGFLPHGGSPADDSPDKPFAERRIPLLFAGTFLNPNQAYAQLKDTSHPVIRKLLLESIEPLVNTDGLPLEQAMCDRALGYGINLQQDPETFVEFSTHLRSLDVFIKAHKRLLTLTRLDNAAIPVTIYGNHWPSRQFKNHIIMPPADYNTILNLMTDTKIVVNMGFVPNGSHERVMSAALNGAVPLTDHNPYFETILGKAVILYKFSELDNLPSLLNRHLTDPDRLARMSQTGRRIARQHTWKCRAAELLNCITETWSLTHD